MTEYSEDFDTDALIEFLEDLKGRVLKILKQGKINGRSFLTLTDEELKKALVYIVESVIIKINIVLNKPIKFKW